MSVVILTDAVTKSQPFYLLSGSRIYPRLFISIATTLVRTIFIFHRDYFSQSPPKESSHHQFCAPGLHWFPFFIMCLGKLLTALISPETVFIPATKFPKFPLGGMRSVRMTAPRGQVLLFGVPGVPSAYLEYSTTIVLYFNFSFTYLSLH